MFGKDIEEYKVISDINLWLWKTYEKNEGEKILFADVRENLIKSQLITDEQHNKVHLARTLNWTFPYVKQVRKRLDLSNEGEKRKYSVYTNIGRIKKPSLLPWKEVQDVYAPPEIVSSTMSWTVNKRTENAKQWMIISSDVLCDGKKIVRELCICEDLSLKFIVMGKEVFSFKNEEQDFTKEFLDNVFEFCAVVPLCKGFEVNIHGVARDQQGIVTGVTEQWEICDVKESKIQSQLRHRAVDCLLICNEHKMKCKSCENIRSNSHKKLNKRSLDKDELTLSVKKTKRISYMSKEELTNRLNTEHLIAKNEKKRADRAVKARKEIKEQMEEFANEDHKDFKVMFENMENGQIPESMQMFWEAQKDALENPDARGNRWHPKIISLCLSVWTRSPDAYQQLKESGMFRLPSGRLLSLYKNSVIQNAGLNDQVLDWLVKEADKCGLDEYGREGGLILDEMSIQEDLQLKSENGVKRLVGLVDLGKEHDFMRALSKGEEKAELATHVCQFVFLGNTGFRFPFAHWPTKEVDSATLNSLFWKAVSKLLLREIKIMYCCCDGGEANRNFININFDGKEPEKENFTVLNPYTMQPMIFIMDFSHNVKKLRNNLSKSKVGGTRKLTFGSKSISWKQWIEAFNWDQKRNSLPLHHRLTVKHFQLGYSSKMRNHLAEQVLNKDMLELMKAYKEDMSLKAGKVVCDFDKAIEFLEVTSTLIKNFTSRQYYTSMADNRLVENDRCLQWLQDWQCEVKGRKDLKASERNKLFLSNKTMNDVSSCILGFKALCRFSFQAHPGCNVSAYRVNSDIVENVFCQQRGRNGLNDNPTYAQYGPTMNSILLGQTTTTTKSNTGKVDRYAFYKPEKLPVKRYDVKKDTPVKSEEVPNINEDKYKECIDQSHNVNNNSSSSCSVCLTEFLFPSSISQSTIGGRNGSNACTLIAIYVCNHFVKQNLPMMCSNVLPVEWSSMMRNCINNGNSLYDTVYQGQNVFLDVEDAYKNFATELQLVSYDENVCNCTNKDMSSVVGMLSNFANDGKKKGCLLITQGISVAILSYGTGEVILVDSHSHGVHGAVICRCTDAVHALVDWYQHFFSKYNGIVFGDICTVTNLEFID